LRAEVTYCAQNMSDTINPPIISPAQSTNSVLMVRPCRFYPNPETAADNAFQSRVSCDVDASSAAARNEFDVAVETLRSAGITVHVFDDTADPEKPDAVFPNNWISTHHDGRVAVFPMYAELRRRERRHDIVDELRKRYRITEVIDYSSFEKEGYCLEGTGSLVLDHANRIAYVSISNRSNPRVIRRFSHDFGYEPVMFTSNGLDGQPIYHTNVMMCVGTEFALAGLGMIPNEVEREQVRARLHASGKDIVELNPDQVANFAGNTLELDSGHGEKVLILSERAVSSFTAGQLAAVTQYADVVPLKIPTIEMAGGSARCMIATIHLPLLKRR
jgi:hypothetical protein